MSQKLIYSTLAMKRFAPEQFDLLMEQGYRLLGDSLLQHNTSSTFGVECMTIPLRIRVKDFKPSKSQRKVLRKNEDLQVITRPFRLTAEKKQLFEAHRSRFHDNPSNNTINNFITPFSHQLPTRGIETALYENGKLTASSLSHIGKKGMNATYCFFDPNLYDRSLGTHTLLLELQLAQSMGIEYFYLGYTNSLPCQFDYKLGFHALEKLDWKAMKWQATPRKVSSESWLEKWKGESIEPWNGMTFGPKGAYKPTA